MSDVSCRAFVFFEDCAKAGLLDLDELIARSPIPRHVLENRRARVPWNDWAELCDISGELLGGPAGLERAGRQVANVRLLDQVRRVASFVVDPRGVLHVAVRWFGPSTYRIIELDIEDLGPHQVRITVDIPEPYRECASILWMAVGAFSAMPEQLGLPPAEVRAAITPRRGVFDVTLPARRSWTASLRRLLGVVRGSRDVIEELSRQEAELGERERQLVETAFAARHAEDELRRSERMNRALLDAFPDLVVHLERDGTVIDARGPGAEMMLAYRGRRTVEMLDDHPDLPRDVVEGGLVHLGRALESGEVQHFEYSAELGGDMRRHETRVIPLGKDEVLVITRDVTDRAQAERERAMTERLVSIGTLAAGVAHEINNPLTYVLGNLDLALLRLSRDGSTIDSIKELLQNAKHGAERVSRLVTDMKAFSRATAAEVGPVNVADSVESSLRMAMHEIRHRADVERHLDPVPPVMADEGRLAQVFINLLVNAAHAMPKDRRGLIAVKTRLDGAGNVVVVVEDDGVGISSHDRERIFDPFFTTKHGEGTGLGLAICHRVVRELGGTLEVESTLGAGSTFSVTLPAAPLRATTSIPPRAAPAAGPAARVLVIDDEPAVARVLSLLLSERHQVDTVHSVDAALSRIGDGEQYDVYLCDLMLPDKDGRHFHEAVRHTWPGHEARVVFVTGGALQPELVEFLDGVDNVCLDKPVAPERLEQAVREAALTARRRLP